MSKRVVVIVNAGAGAVARGCSTEEIREALSKAGVDAVIEPTPCERLTDAARAAARAGSEAVVAAGGDGTVNAVASALVGGDTPLGVLPLGTLNHFAGALGIPTLAAAAEVIAAGHVRRVDVGEVNGRFFLNNSSIGVYPRMVVERDAQREALGRSKRRAMLSAARKVLGQMPIAAVRVDAAGVSRHRHVSFLFVGNNEYEMSVFDPGKRAALDAGVLSLWVTTSQSRRALVRLMLRALIGRVEQSRDFESFVVPEAWIDVRRSTIRVALDGEVVRMIPPLHYRSLPGALRVLAPAAG